MKKLSFALLLVFAAFGAFAQDENQIMSMLNVGNLTKARSLIDASTLAPDMKQYYLGQLFSKLGKETDAKAAFAQVATLNPKNALGYTGLVRQALDAGNVTDVASLVKKIGSVGKKNDAVWRALSQAYATSKNKDLGKAIEFATKAQGINRKNITNWTNLGSLYLEQGNGGKAMSSYDQALLIDPNNADVYFNKGIVANRGRLYDDAIGYFQRSIDINPEYAPAQLEMGDLYMEQKKSPKKAAEYYQKYTTLMPDDIAAKRKLVRTLFFNKQFKDAATLIEDIRKTDSSNLVMERLRGYVALENEEYPKGVAAMKSYFKIAKTEEILSDDYEKYGKLLAKTGQDSLAILNLQKSIAMDTAKAENWGLIGEAYFTKKKYNDAIAAYTQKIATAPTAVKSLDYFRLGSSLYATKQWGKADTAFAKVVEMQPANMLGYLWRARSNAQIDPQSTAGTAKPYYENYIAKAEPEAAKNGKGLAEAYSYLGYFYYLAKDNTLSKENWNKVLAIEPANQKALDAIKLIK